MPDMLTLEIILPDKLTATAREHWLKALRNVQLTLVGGQTCVKDHQMLLVLRTTAGAVDPVCLYGMLESLAEETFPVVMALMAQKKAARTGH